MDKIRKFVKRSRPLDLHTVFAYWILFKYFDDTCFVLEEEGRIIGFVSGVISSKQPEILYLWQIGIDPAYRGRRHAETLIKRVVEIARAKGCRCLQVTIAPDNESSYKVFSRFARDHGLSFSKTGEVDVFDSFIDAKIFENLYEIGDLGTNK